MHMRRALGTWRWRKRMTMVIRNKPEEYRRFFTDIAPPGSFPIKNITRKTENSTSKIRIINALFFLLIASIPNPARTDRLADKRKM